MKRKRYSRKFQRMAVERMRTCENVGELARELGVQLDCQRFCSSEAVEKTRREPLVWLVDLSKLSRECRRLSRQSMILLQAIDIWVGTHRRFSRASADLPLFAAVLDAMDLGAVSPYQPYWAVRAHLLQRLRNAREAADAYDRAIGLGEDPAVKEFLLQRRG